MAPTYLTQEEYDKLKSELEYLRSERRQEVAERLREALDGSPLGVDADVEGLGGVLGVRSGEVLGVGYEPRKNIALIGLEKPKRMTIMPAWPKCWGGATAEAARLGRFLVLQ